MKIRKMTATFGKLKNATLELGDGLNIINAPNEYGKSTWCAFIKAMLYGIDSSERDRSGHLAAKSRYKPWDGSPTAGTMELEHQGSSITMQRTNQGSAPFKNLIAVHTGTAEFIRDLNGENAGEKLTGVSEHVFERTAYIRRPELRVNQTADLEKRISGLVFSGDEQSSFTEADELLRSWQRKLRYNRTGTIPALEADLSQARCDLEKVESAAAEKADMRAAVQRLASQKEALEEDMRTHDKLERRAAARKIIETGKKLERAQEREKELREKLTRDGRLITRGDISEMRDNAASIAPLRKVRNDAEKALWQAEKNLSDLEAKCAASPLRDLSEEEALELARVTGEVEARAKKKQKKPIARAVPITLMTLGIILAIVFSGVLTGFSVWFAGVEAYVGFNLYGIIAGGVLVLAGLILLLWRPGPSQEEKRLAELLSRYGVTSADKLSGMVYTYTGLLRSRSGLETARDAARANYDSAAQASQDAEDRAISQVRLLMPEVKNGAEIQKAITDTEALIEEHNRAEFDLSSTRSVYETMVHQYGGQPEPEEGYLAVPLRDREDTAAALIRTQAQLTEATRRFDVLTGEQHTLGDPAILEGRIQAIREQIDTQEEKYRALGLAADVLAEANTELTTRFSPLISKKAGEYMERLTDGRYEKLSFDRGFDAAARSLGDTSSRNVLSLSDGTADEIYFSLRLAMCELILGGEDPCPIILDDALLNFDDRRMLEALDLLAKIAEKRQVILFSCHRREADALEGRDDVRIIRGSV